MTHANPQVEEALAKLREVTPLNLHMKTDANFRLKTDFESVWSNHGPQAARYLLLPYYWAGKYGGQPAKYQSNPLHFTDDLRQHPTDNDDGNTLPDSDAEVQGAVSVEALA